VSEWVSERVSEWESEWEQESKRTSHGVLQETNLMSNSNVVCKIIVLICESVQIGQFAIASYWSISLFIILRLLSDAFDPKCHVSRSGRWETMITLNIGYTSNLKPWWPQTRVSGGRPTRLRVCVLYISAPAWRGRCGSCPRRLRWEPAPWRHSPCTSVAWSGASPAVLLAVTEVYSLWDTAQGLESGRESGRENERVNT